MELYEQTIKEQATAKYQDDITVRQIIFVLFVVFTILSNIYVIKPKRLTYALCCKSYLLTDEEKRKAEDKK